MQSAANQLMARSMSNMAVHLDTVARDMQASNTAVKFDSSPKLPREIQTRIASPSNNLDNRGSLSIGSVASSSSTSGEVPKGASSWVSASQQPVAARPSSLPATSKVAAEAPSRVAFTSTTGNRGTNKATGFSVGSMASSSSSSGEGPKGISAFASGSQQPTGFNRKEQSNAGSGQISVGAVAASPVSSSSSFQGHVNRGSIWGASRPTRKNLWSTVNPL